MIAETEVVAAPAPRNVGGLWALIAVAVAVPVGAWGFTIT